MFEICFILMEFKIIIIIYINMPVELYLNTSYINATRNMVAHKILARSFISTLYNKTHVFVYY